MDELELIERFAPQEGPDEAIRRRAESRLAEAISRAGQHATARRAGPRRPLRPIAVVVAVAAAIVISVILVNVLSPAGGGGAQNAYAAVDHAGAATATAARHSGKVVVLVTHSGKAYAGETVRWNNGNASVKCTGVGSCGELLFVDRVLFTKNDGSWTKVDKGGLPNYMRQRYVSPALQSMSRSTFRRITGGMQHLKIKPGHNGTTIYSGREASGVLTRDPNTGERIRVLPFGFVAKGAAANPASILSVSLTVGSDGIIQGIDVAWGTGASAWGYGVTYSNLGRTPPLTAPTVSGQ
jgi:hypothetical protein